MSTLEDQLILSQLPYPKYYNGYDWNTIVGNTRKHIPQYLHEDLPSLKMQRIRQQFKKINQIACPRLTYFQNRIISQKHRHVHPRDKEKVHRSGHHDDCAQLEADIRHIRSEMQYALLTTERNSNVIRNLVGRAAQLEEELAMKLKKRGKEGKGVKRRSHSVVGIQQRQNCFENTLDIVMSARKQQASMLREQQNETDIKINTVLLPFIE